MKKIIFISMLMLVTICFTACIKALDFPELDFPELDFPENEIFFECRLTPSYELTETYAVIYQVYGDGRLIIFAEPQNVSRYLPKEICKIELQIDKKEIKKLQNVITKLDLSNSGGAAFGDTPCNASPLKDSFEGTFCYDMVVTTKLETYKVEHNARSYQVRCTIEDIISNRTLSEFHKEVETEYLLQFGLYGPYE